MSIKDLFGKRSNKIVTKQQADKLVDEVESQEYVSEVNKGKQKFIPKADYSDPKNFAKYGSAEKYYEDTVEHIYSSYPYDGSEAEKNKWAITRAVEKFQRFDGDTGSPEVQSPWRNARSHTMHTTRTHLSRRRALTTLETLSDKCNYVIRTLQICDIWKIRCLQVC